MGKIKEFFLGNREPAYSNKLPNQLLLTCRALVGGYLIYLAKELLDGINSPDNGSSGVVIIAAIIIFIICGFIFLYASVRNFVIGRYVGGKLDLGENLETTLDGKDAEDFDDIVTEDEAIEEYAADKAAEHDGEKLE